MEGGGRLFGAASLARKLKASGLLKVVCDDSILEINEMTLRAMLNSSFILPSQAQDALSIEVITLGKNRDQNLFQFKIYENVEPADEGEFGTKEEGGEKGMKGVKGEKGEKGEDFLALDPAAMISEIADRLENILMEEYYKEQKQYQRKLAEAQTELKPLEEKMRQLNDRERELFAKAGMTSLRRTEVLKKIQSLERRQQEMEMELVAAAAREDELQKQIAILGDQTAKKLQQDTVLDELKNILQLRENEMKTVQKMMESGNASQSDYFKAREAVAQARIEMVKRQEAISESIGGGAAMQERVKELTDIAIENAESQAVLKHIEEQLSIIKDKKILELADQYEIEIGLKQDTMRRSYDFTQKSIQEYNYTMQRMLPPSVSVLGGD